MSATVLTADDDLGILMLVATLLEREGHALERLWTAVQV